MKKEGRSMLVIVAYIITMLLITLVAITTISKDVPSEFEENDEKETETPKIVYLPVLVDHESECESKEETAETEEGITYIVKSYEGRLAIYENGELVHLIDVYIKTLPKADRDLLEEGIVARSKEELQKIIEDYTA